MENKLQEIQIIHPQLGKIIIHSELEEEMNNQIGKTTADHQKYPIYYYADITKNGDGTFTIRNFHVIKPEAIDVGYRKIPSGGKSFITVITNRWIKGDLVVYPSGVIYAKYHNFYNE